jgi:hypothetical protein
MVTPPDEGLRTMFEFADSWRLLLAFTAIDANGVMTDVPPVNG